MTALRLIEREEKSDAECAQRQKSTGFMPRGRPKKWKQMGLEVSGPRKILLRVKMSYFFQVLRRNVQERIEGNQLETRSENKMWLVRHLELIRIITMEDLRIVKSLGQPVFPPHYNILDHYIGLYHEALSTRVR